MSNPCRRARRLVRSLQEASDTLREQDFALYYRHRLPWVAAEARWLGASQLRSEDDLRDARKLAFRLASDLYVPVRAVESQGLSKSAVRPMRRAYRDAIALCEALENDTRGAGLLHVPHDLVFGLRNVVGGVLDARAARLAAVRASEAEKARMRMRAVVEAELAGERQPPGRGAAKLVAPGRTCRSLVAMAVRILPVEHQLRYAEEFRADVARIRRRQRLPYAIRLVLYAWSLRRVLVEVTATAAVGVSRDEKNRY